MKTATQYPIIVNHSLSLAEMFSQAGYTNSGGNVIETFPKKGSGVQELTAEIVQFGRQMSFEAVVLELDSQGLRPATLEELLAFRAQHKQHELQEGKYNFAIMAIGSEADVWGNERICIAWHHEWVSDPTPGNNGVELKAYWYGFNGFHATNYFLAVRK